MGYSLVDDNPLVDEDRELYAQMMRDSVERLIHESEVIVDLGGLSESKSVVAMFSIPPLARPRPRVSNSNATGLPHSSSTNGASNPPHRRSALGPFVHSSNGRTGIRSANHAAGLIGLLHLAGAHPTGLVGMLGGTTIGPLGFRTTFKPSSKPTVR